MEWRAFRRYNRGMKRNLRRLLSEEGQTAIEYIMILVVSAGIGITFVQKVKEFMLKNPNSIIGQQMRFLDAGFDKASRYQRYSLPK